MNTFTVTVRKVVTLKQTYTVEARTERAARRIARNMASDVNADTFTRDWRVEAITAGDAGMTADEEAGMRDCGGGCTPEAPCANSRPALTQLETKVLAVLKQQAEDCSGGDFALVEEVKVPGLSRQALGGVLTSLGAKHVITVWPPTETNGGPREGGERWTQVTFDDRD